MTQTTLTIISGIVLVIVFALVGWTIRRRQNSQDKRHSEKRNHS